MDQQWKPTGWGSGAALVAVPVPASRLPAGVRDSDREGEQKQSVGRRPLWGAVSHFARQVTRRSATQRFFTMQEYELGPGAFREHWRGLTL